MSQRRRHSPKRSAAAPPPPAVPSDPAEFVTQALQLQPDPVQLELLRTNPHRLVLNCTRQWGKSTITAAKAVHQAWFTPRSLIVVISPSERQSAEFLRKASTYVEKLGVKPRGDGDNPISLLFPNRSRIVGLPGKDSTIRGFSAVSLLLVDEASRVPDGLYLAVRPMLAASDGQLWLISTPNGRRGFFYEAWASAQTGPAAPPASAATREPTGPPGSVVWANSIDSGWTRISIPATLCPRIRPEFLEEERRSMPKRFYEQEYLCQFHDAEDAVYSLDTLNRAFARIRPVLLPSSTPHPPAESARYYSELPASMRSRFRRGYAALGIAASRVAR